MRIQASCDSCSHQFSVSSTAAGKRVKCPECGEAVRVSNEDDEEPVQPRRSASGNQKSRGKKSGGDNQQGLMIGLLAGSGGAVLLGLLAFLFMRPAAQPLQAPPDTQQPVAQAAPTI